jgi:hypothetical protein
MKRRVWLIVLVLYAAGAIADGAYHLAVPPSRAVRSNLAAIPVAICAGLFWPIDIIARPLLLSS